MAWRGPYPGPLLAFPPIVDPRQPPNPRPHGTRTALIAVQIDTIPRRYVLDVPRSLFTSVDHSSTSNSVESRRTAFSAASLACISGCSRFAQSIAKLTHASISPSSFSTGFVQRTVTARAAR